ERMLCRRVRDDELAANLVQDTFLKIEELSVSLETEAQARRYLFEVAKNLAVDRQRRETQGAEKRSESGALFEAYRFSIKDLSLANDQLRAVEAALSELPRHCREVLILSRVHGLTHSQIAAQLRVSKQLVEKYAVKAALHCRAKLRAL
ncbi:MAG: RNA polymerase sigma factor, partial [Brevundimonas sp.]